LKYDLVVALHACGGLTDAVLLHALFLEAAFIVCPCCFTKLRRAKKTIVSLEDASIGYANEISKCFEPAATHKERTQDAGSTEAGLFAEHFGAFMDLLCLLAESPLRDASWTAMVAVNSLRFRALQRLHSCNDAHLTLQMKQFDASYSLRNIVLFGERTTSTN